MYFARDHATHVKLVSGENKKLLCVLCVFAVNNAVLIVDESGC